MKNLVFIMLVLSSFLYSKDVISNFSTYSRAAHQMIAPLSTKGYESLISDREFLDTSYTFDDVLEFFKYFPLNRFTKEEKLLIFNECQKKKINVLVLLTKIQLESSLISDGYTNASKYYYVRCWALGCKMYTTIISNGRWIKPYSGFDKQIVAGAEFLREKYDEFSVGKYVYINLGTKIYPTNGGSYALYKYTPFLGRVVENGVESSGNETFVKLYAIYKKKWDTVRKANGILTYTNQQINTNTNQ